MGQETITLTTTELKKVLVIEKLVAKSLTSEDAATALGLSKRQVLRLKARYIKEGAKGIVHKNRGRKPSHTIPESIREQVVSLYEQKYYGSNNSHLSELLEEHEQLDLSVSSVRRILVVRFLNSVT
ncbi:helix-turn-helix domain-containing protein [Effusibacillus lacus]|uniref:Integrase n=1 Tax=Effusibacillus lacus TaxID=1348429 RepID=A0A292YR00_9BACL|nr:homeodomain-containing protein [Effusibacillus lacus]GAX91341.1 integrase [Effusibacillus lacus]